MAETVPDGGQSFVGVGVFTVPEAARLAGVPMASIRRWTFGDPRRDAAPALARQLPRVDGQDALGFYNLVEVLFLRDLTRQGVSWPAIRRAAERAQQVLRDDHPLATRRIFHTDGRGLFLEVAGETGDRRLLDLLAGNYAMLEVLERSFTKALHFDAPGGHASLWRPVNDLERVVVDPARNFGRPTNHETGVPTDVLAAALVAEGGDAARVACRRKPWNRLRHSRCISGCAAPLEVRFRREPPAGAGTDARAARRRRGLQRGACGRPRPARNAGCRPAGGDLR